MPANLLKGKVISRSIRDTIRGAVGELADQGQRPGLAVVLVGDDPASAIYVRKKAQACDKLGLHSVVRILPESTSEGDLLALIDQLNADPAIHGILVQLPLPPSMAADDVLRRIDPRKDVDGFHPENVGLLLLGQPRFVACTPFGMMKMLEHAGCELKGKHAVVVGRSNIVGKPIALLLLQQHATVTICHSRTQDLEGHVRRAELVVAAIGRAEMIRGDWIKEGAVVLDVGINRLDDGRIVGDVDFAGASERASWITPVPGGVGPMTITMLLWNTVEAARR
ncbi:MAG: bifunctional methylenetetrahydrofolate dehydrogenase/methenyltetrahydrofolate cyclohydrolase FolD, partial [Myxococcales bacterium]|nr:bifunctional methylenetetrahydrofolate dehydrogenase/methenyltetrahydrofolate cyclohydrolase FolD [Myxococcales bacterium]